MAEDIAFENGQISNFEGLLTLTLDQVILHTVVHQSWTSTYMPNFIEIEKTLWADGSTHIRTHRHLRLAVLGRLCRSVDLKRQRETMHVCVCYVHTCMCMCVYMHVRPVQAHN